MLSEIYTTRSPTYTTVRCRPTVEPMVEPGTVNQNDLTTKLVLKKLRARYVNGKQL